MITVLLLTSLGFASDEAESEAKPQYPRVSAYGTFVGGGAVEVVDRRQDDVDDRQNRFWTPALARIGLVGRLGDEWSVNSEVEFNAGPYGTSVWEGQAAIQVRNQLIRYETTDVVGDGDQVAIEVGRVTDPASLNYFSYNIANLLLSDPLARDGLLLSGFNRGNGIRAAYTVADALTAAFTVNGGNPTSTTATLVVGGTFPPFQRLWEVPWSNVGRDARGFPTATFNTVVATPSLQLSTDIIDAQVAAQFFWIDVNTSVRSNDIINARNLRGGVRLKLFDNRFAIFGNASQVVNEVVELDDLNQVSEDEQFLGITGSGGFDVRIGKRNSVGAQYDLAIEEERGLDPAYNHYVNAGVTIGLSDAVALSGRFAFFQLCQEQESVENCDVNGLRQGFLTMTAVLGASRSAMP